VDFFGADHHATGRPRAWSAVAVDLRFGVQFIGMAHIGDGLPGRKKRR